MTITQADYDFKLQVVEVPDLDLAAAADPTVTHTLSNTGRLTPATTPAVSKVWADQIQLSAGTLTIDLTNLDNGNLPNIDMTGLKVQIWKIFAASANTAHIVAVPAASNGYDFLGPAASGSISIGPGGAAMMLFNEDLEDVDATNHDITFTSSDVDAILDIQVLAG